ncbi:hypothetical protein INT43_002878 [Umbelopsis isabellina]|uniref:Inner centromere protein ARK-binding domain-containing protein n=1 Tax=Mortierella isabellina TaxID=91625 RepID=A0A8H7UKF7_MORIS|nr:hypothetical protein INT43_002878 [Umbelopsis isabellina]
MSISWISFVKSTAKAHAKYELDGVDDTLSTHLGWLSDLENLDRKAPSSSSNKDKACLNSADLTSWYQPPTKTYQAATKELGRLQDTCITENITAVVKDTASMAKKEVAAGNDIAKDPTQLASFFKDFFPDYKIDDVLNSPEKPQGTDVGLPSPPMSSPPSPIPSVDKNINHVEQGPCDESHSQKPIESDDPFREYFEEKLTASRWSRTKSTRPPPPTYSKELPAKHKLLQQSHSPSNSAKKTSTALKYSATKQAAKSCELKKQSVDQVHETMKGALPHARLNTLAKYEIDLSKAPINSRLLQMAEKIEHKAGKSATKVLASTDKRASKVLSMDRINQLAQPKRMVERPASSNLMSTSSTRRSSVIKTQSKLPVSTSSARRNGITHVRQKRAAPMSLTAAAIALDGESTPRPTSKTRVGPSSFLSKEPDWVAEQDLEAALEEQSKVDPDEIFGKFSPLEVDQVFRSKHITAIHKNDGYGQVYTIEVQILYLSNSDLFVLTSALNDLPSVP